MRHLTSEQRSPLVEPGEHLIWPKSPPRHPQNGLCKAVLPPSPVFKI